VIIIPDDIHQSNSFHTIFEHFCMSESILSNYQTLYNNYISLGNKLNEMENEKYEHQVVIDTIKGLEKERICHRLVGGILIERTVGEVLPALMKSVDILSDSMNTLSKELEKRQVELNDYKTKHDIKVKGETKEKQEGKRIGVLA
jgi:prefoldin subunit 2